MNQVVKSLYVEIKRDEYEGLRARVAELEAQQPSMVMPEQDGSAAQKSFWAGFEASSMHPLQSNIREAWNAFKSSDQFARLNASRVVRVPMLEGGSTVPDDYRNQASGYRAGWNDCRAAQPDHSEHDLKMVAEGFPAATERMSKFVEVVRECERLASSYCGTIDGVEEHGGDDHEDPTCAIWHRLYYAMFDGDRVIAELRQIAAQHAQQKESER